MQRGSILQYVRDCLDSFQKFSLMAIFVLCVCPWHRHKTSSWVAIVNISNINKFTIALLFCCSMNKTSGLQCRKWWILESHSPYSNYSSAREIMMLNGQLTKDWTHNVVLFRGNIAHLQQWRRWSPIACRFFRNLFTPQHWFMVDTPSQNQGLTLLRHKIKKDLCLNLHSGFFIYFVNCQYSFFTACNLNPNPNDGVY